VITKVVDGKDKCITCDEGYILSVDGNNCVRSPGYGCLRADISTECKECEITDSDVGLDPVKKICVKNQIAGSPGCKLYKNPVSGGCETCYPGF